VASDEDFSVDLASALGADSGTSIQCLTVYIPDRDRTGKEIGDQRNWVLRAARLLAEIGGGATIQPAAEGGWYDDDAAE
jgi:hypothetical protein